MSSIPGDTYAERAIAGTLGNRKDSSLTSHILQAPPAIARIDGASHSGMIGGYSGGPDNSYFKRLAKQLGARKCGWLSSGGSVACWPTANAGTDGGYSWILNMFRPPTDSDGAAGYMPHTNVAVIQHGAEDLFALGSQNLKPYQEALKTEISRYCASVVHEVESDPVIVSPLASGVAAAGGQLAAGTYYYKIGAYNSNGESGPNAGETVVAGVPANGKVTLSWVPAQGATGYRIYRGTASGAENTRIVDIPAPPPGANISWTDDGSLTGTATTPNYGANIARHWTFGSGMATGAAGTNWALSNGGYRSASPTQAGVNSATQWGQYVVDPDYPGNLVVAIGLGVIPGAVGAGQYYKLAVTIDGVAQPDITINLDKGGHADAEGGKMNGIVLRFGRTDCGIPVYNAAGSRISFTPGAHTIKLALKETGSGGAWFILDYAQIEADPLDGPLVLLPSSFWRLPGGYAGIFVGWPHNWLAGQDPISDAAVLAVNNAQQAVMSDFPSRCIYADLDGAVNKNPKYFSDGLHFSNQGHALATKVCLDAVRNSGLLTSRVASAVGQRNLGPFDGGVWRTIGGVYGTGSNQRPFINTWGAYSATGVYPSYMVGALDGRMRLRGWVKQTGAAAANSYMFQNDVGSGPSSTLGSHDQPLTIYNGTAFQLGILRADTETAGTARGVYTIFNGSVAAGSAVIFSAIEWPMEA